MRSGERGSEAASREGDKEGSGDAAARLSANLQDETSLELGRVSAPRAAAPAFAGDRPGPQPGARDGHAGHVATGPCATEPGPGRPAETEGLAAPSRGPRPPLVKGTLLVPPSPRAGFSAPAASRLRERLRFQPLAPRPHAEPRDRASAFPQDVPGHGARRRPLTLGCKQLEKQTGETLLENLYFFQKLLCNPARGPFQARPTE